MKKIILPVTQQGEKLLTQIKDELTDNGNKISDLFIASRIAECKVEYGKVGNSCRVCVLTTPNNQKLVGYALVLDPANDIPAKGREVALKMASNQMWSLVGGIAKLIV